MTDDMNIDHILDYYMGKNTPERQEFIVDNLRFELDEIEDEVEIEEAMAEVAA